MEYTNSRKQTESLTKPQIEQFPTYNINNDDVKENQNQIKYKNLQLYTTNLQEIILDLLAEKAGLTLKTTAEELFKCVWSFYGIGA